MDEKPISTNKNDFEKFSNKGSDMPMVVYWLAFALSLIFVGLFWFMGFNVSNALEEKQQEKDQIAALLSSPEIVEVEEQANNFKSAVSKLSSVSATRIKKTKLLVDLCGYFTKDLKIGSMSISSSGKLSLEGSAPSYKSVGEFMIALNEYERVSNVSLGSVSMISSEDSEANENVSFSISSDISMTKDLTEGEYEQE